VSVAVRDLGRRLAGLWSSDRLLRGFSLLGLGELFIRLSRIVTAIVLARCLEPVELGVAASAITCFEIVRILANNGLGQMVIRAREEELAATCNTAWAGMWAVCIAMGGIQLAAGAILAELTGRPELFAMVACLVGVYLVMPFSMVQYWLLQRAHKLGTVAGINTAQVSTDNLLTAGLAIAGLGPWAIVLPKLVTAPIWLVGMRCAISWRREREAGWVPFAEVWRFCLPILTSEIMGVVRFQADKPLVGGILGLEALGIYYFAFNAGYGLSLVLTNALAAASFPYLAEARLAGRELIVRFERTLVRLALPIAVLITLQSAAVFVYVPILFGERWEPYTLIVAILALSATTNPVYDLSVHLLRAAGLPTSEMTASTLFTAVFMGAFALALPFGLAHGVAVLALTTITLQIIFAAWARWRVLNHLDVTPSGGAYAPTAGAG